jgi:hypothetical protein
MAGPARAAGRAGHCWPASSQVSRSAPRSSWSCPESGSSSSARSRCSAIGRAAARWPSDSRLANRSYRCRSPYHCQCHCRYRWRPTRGTRSSPPERADRIEDGIEQASGPGEAGSRNWPRMGASSGSWASRAAIRIRPTPQAQARSAMQRAAPRRSRRRPSADGDEPARSRRRSLRPHVARCVDPYGLLGPGRRKHPSGSVAPRPSEDTPDAPALTESFHALQGADLRLRLRIRLVQPVRASYLDIATDAADVASCRGSSMSVTRISNRSGRSGSATAPPVLAARRTLLSPPFECNLDAVNRFSRPFELNPVCRS